MFSLILMFFNLPILPLKTSGYIAFRALLLVVHVPVVSVSLAFDVLFIESVGRLMLMRPSALLWK